MTHPPDPRDAFDAALIPGMRERLAGEYARFRARETEVVRSMASTASTYRERDCPCCGAHAAGIPPALRAHGLDLLECSGCGLTFSRQVMNEADDAARYRDSSLDREAMRLRRSGPYLTLESARDHYYLARLMERGRPPGDLLEIGCGTGTLLLEAEKLGWHAMGIEPGEAAASVAAERGANVTRGWFPSDLSTSPRAFDAICMLDVLEHFADPIGFLREVRGRLAPKGRLLIQVPNWDSLLIRVQGVESSVVCPGHWSYFTPTSLVAVASHAGFRPLLVETVVSERDRLDAFPPDHVQMWLTRLRPEAPSWPFSASVMHQHLLGYKLAAVFEPASLRRGA